MYAPAMDPSALTLDSRKQQLAKGWSYLLGAMDLHAALALRITHAAVLQVRGEARQAAWKEARDLIDATGRYRVLALECRPWRIDAVLTAVPRTALRRGVAAKPHVLTLLAEGLTTVAPQGIFVGKHPDNVCHLSIDLDANAGSLEASLYNTRLGSYVVKRVRAMVPPDASLPDSGRPPSRRRA
jgi:hypothetical protein